MRMVPPSRPSLLSYGRQSVTEEDIDAVVSVLRSSSLTQGSKIAEFESELAKFCGARFATVVNSGTAALHIACLAAEIGKQDEVITSPITFVASSNSVFYCGGTPIFADIEVDTVLIDPLEVEKKITERTRAVLPVHFAGQSADLEKLAQIVKAAETRQGQKIYIIEDAAHALGATYRGSRVGSCAYSDMTIFSFHPVKHITTGEGGAVLTNDPRLHRRLQLFRSHGITRDLDLLEDLSTQPWGYEQHELGFNYRLTDFQCALGLSQLKKVRDFVSRRRQIAQHYREAFSNLPYVGILKDYSDRENSYHLFVILLDFETMKGRTAIMERLRSDAGLITQVHYIPVHTQPYYKKRLGLGLGSFPKAENYYQQCLSVPIFPAMTESDVERVIEAVRKLG